MTRILFSIVAAILCLPCFAQQFTVKDAKILSENGEAEIGDHVDGNGDPCAMLKVYIPQMPGLQFSNAMIMNGKDATYADGAYILYAANGASKMRVMHPDSEPLEVTFSNLGIGSLKGGKIYGLTLVPGIKTTQTILFDITPLEGKVIINDEPMAHYDEGKYQIEAEPGKSYHYQILPKGYYKTETGDVAANGNIKETQVVRAVIKPRTKTVHLVTTPADARVYIDSEECQRDDYGNVEVPLGPQEITVVAKGYKTKTKAVNYLNEEGRETLNISLAKAHAGVAVYVPDGATLYIDNKIVPGFYNGKPLSLKPGTHLFTIEVGGKTHNKKIKINPDTETVNLN